MVKECALSTSKLPPRGLPSNSVFRITDLPNMSSAVNHGCKATNYCNDPKFSDKQAKANSADQDQTAPRGAV